MILVCQVDRDETPRVPGIAQTIHYYKICARSLQGPTMISLGMAPKSYTVHVHLNRSASDSTKHTVHVYLYMLPHLILRPPVSNLSVVMASIVTCR